VLQPTCNVFPTTIERAVVFGYTDYWLPSHIKEAKVLQPTCVVPPVHAGGNRSQEAIALRWELSGTPTLGPQHR